MNCRQFQHELYAYLEGSLHPRVQAAAEKHLEECLTCRERSREERETARLLVDGFRRATQHLELPVEMGERVTAALAAERAAREKAPGSGFFWRRLTWPVAWAASAIVLLTGWLVFVVAPGQRMVSRRPHPVEHAVLIQLSIVTPIHTFRRENGAVIDAVTYQTNFVNQRLQTELARLN